MATLEWLEHHLRHIARHDSGKPVQAVVVSQLGMERDREHLSLARRPRDDRSISPRISTSAPYSAIQGARMKIPRSGPPAMPATSRSASKLRNLTAERVALGADVHQAEVVTVEHDQPGARSQDGDTLFHEVPQRLGQPLALDPRVIVVDSPPGITTRPDPRGRPAPAPRAHRCPARATSARAPQTRPAGRARRLAGLRHRLRRATSRVAPAAARRPTLRSPG